MDTTTSTSALLPDYRYRPLESKTWIRVIQLYPSQTFGDDLVCRIIHMDRDWLMASTDPDLNYYSAVSYAWGQPNFCKQLCCEDESTGKSAVSITENVDIMLRRFRKRHSLLNLWVDAICLNQKDRIEIQQQLLQMGSIYTESQKTRVWLGHEDHGIAGVFAFFRVLGQRSRAEGISALDQAALEEILHVTIGPDSLTALQEFFGKAWFTRRWILQELFLSQDVLVFCSGAQISWTELCAGLRTVEQLTEHGLHAHIHIDGKAMRALELSRTTIYRSRHLLDALWDHHGSECLDPRDKVFAVLGFSESFPWLGDIQYEQAPENIFRDFAARLISDGHLHQVLNHAIAFGTTSETNETMPSWCPNWAAQRCIHHVPNWSKSDLTSFTVGSFSSDRRMVVEEIREDKTGLSLFPAIPRACETMNTVSSLIVSPSFISVTCRTQQYVFTIQEVAVIRTCVRISQSAFQVDILVALLEYLEQIHVRVTATSAFSHRKLARFLTDHMLRSTSWRPKTDLTNGSPRDEMIRQVERLLDQSHCGSPYATDEWIPDQLELLRILHHLFNTNHLLVSYPIELYSYDYAKGCGLVIGLSARPCTPGDFFMSSTLMFSDSETWDLTHYDGVVECAIAESYLFKRADLQSLTVSGAQAKVQRIEEIFSNAHVSHSPRTPIRGECLVGRCMDYCTVMGLEIFEHRERLDEADPVNYFHGHTVETRYRKIVIV